ncbi:MAG: diacylglycerol/lipid kinase family protein [Acidobacteriota bacterium]
MKVAKVLHNPGAGDEEHSKKELISLIESNGFECKYSSTKKKRWKDFEPKIDFLVAAGGDGTVRKVAKQVLDRKVLDRDWPIALLPLGTANNIASTLGITGSTEEIIQSWHSDRRKKFDVGKIHHEGDKEANFFLEAVGYGIFPYLMLEMKKQDKELIEDPQQKMQAALELLHQIVLAYEPRHCELVVDGINLSGKLLLVEILNTRSIGPNLVLAPDADPGDGEFEVVLVPAEHKERFASYVLSKMGGAEETFAFQTFKGRNIRMSWEGTHFHVDDKVNKLATGSEVLIELKEGLVEFLVP